MNYIARFYSNKELFTSITNYTNGIIHIRGILISVSIATASWEFQFAWTYCAVFLMNHSWMLYNFFLKSIKDFSSNNHRMDYTYNILSSLTCILNFFTCPSIKPCKYNTNIILTTSSYSGTKASYTSPTHHV